MGPLRCLALLLRTVLYSSVLFAQPDCPALQALRTAYLGHSTLEQAMESKALAESFLPKATGECAVYIQAHRWISVARSADFGFNPAGKLSRLNEGLGQLDDLIEQHPDLDILKALRLTVTGTAPRFLSVDEHWKSDLAALKRLLVADHWAESPKFSAWMSDLAEQIESERS
jgi:hypothetical protein